MHVRTRAITPDRTLPVWLSGSLMIVLLALLLGGCNTIEGFGRDVQAAGGAVSETAEDVENEM